MNPKLQNPIYIAIQTTTLTAIVKVQHHLVFVARTPKKAKFDWLTAMNPLPTTNLPYNIDYQIIASLFRTILQHVTMAMHRS